MNDHNTARKQVKVTNEDLLGMTPQRLQPQYW